MAPSAVTDFTEGEFVNVCVCVCESSSMVWKSMMWLFVFVDELVFICMCLLIAGSVPGPAHLLASPNW